MKAGRDVRGGTTKPAKVSADCAPPRRSTASTRFSSSTPAGRPASRKASCTPSAGYLLGVHETTKYVFDLREDDVYWCTADVGWITGHSYVVYGPLAAGATVFMYEGAPDTPAQDRWWKIDRAITRSRSCYTAPTAIRAFIKWGDQWPEGHDLSSLRLLGTVGEPINPEAWMWFHEKIGGGRCPIVDTWWQTETGAPHDHPAARRDADHARHGDAPFFGWTRPSWTTPATRSARTWAANWSSASRGRRCCARSTATTNATPSSIGASSATRDFISPATARGATSTAISGSWAASTTCSTWPATAWARARSRARWCRIASVAEAAVVGKPDEIKGQGVVAFVTLKGGQHGQQGAGGRAQEARRRGASGRSRGRTRSGLRGCAAQDTFGQDHATACSRRWPAARRSQATPRRSKTCRSWRSCRRARIKGASSGTGDRRTAFVLFDDFRSSTII